MIYVLCLLLGFFLGMILYGQLERSEAYHMEQMRLEFILPSESLRAATGPETQPSEQLVVKQVASILAKEGFR